MTPEEMYRIDFEEAQKNWQCVSAWLHNGVATVEAQAGTGSRYVVTASDMGIGGVLVLGGQKLVTVSYPWKAVYPVNSNGSGLHDHYLHEKFVGDEKRNGGDVGALFMTIRAALDRLDGEETPDV